MGLTIHHRSDLLAEIAKSAQDNGKCFIGFSGTHGKTTTSGMASYVLEEGKLEPAFVVGGIVPEVHTNAQHKNGNQFIAELDESDGTIVKYHPNILVINNIEEDHLDFYKNGMSDLIKTFDKEISQSKKVLINNDNSGTNLLAGNFITFGLKNAEYMAKNIVSKPEGITFDFYHNDKFIVEINIQLTGKHNVYNTLAVLSALMEAGINVVNLKPHFLTFTGMGRRFQKVGEINGIKLYDDYAHHPTEIKATLDSAATKFGKENIVAVFQPHRYTRLKGLWKEFEHAFKNAKRIIVTDVYAASENPIEGITGENFAKCLEKAEYIGGNIKTVAEKLLPTLKQTDVVIGMGAGTITTLGKDLMSFKN